MKVEVASQSLNVRQGVAAIRTGAYKRSIRMQTESSDLAECFYPLKGSQRQGVMTKDVGLPWLGERLCAIDEASTWALRLDWKEETIV